MSLISYVRENLIEELSKEIEYRKIILEELRDYTEDFIELRENKKIERKPNLEQRLLNKEYNKNSEDEENEIRKLVNNTYVKMGDITKTTPYVLLNALKYDKRFKDKIMPEIDQVQIVFDNLKNIIIKFYYPQLILMQSHLESKDFTKFDFSKIKPISEYFKEEINEYDSRIFEKSLMEPLAKIFEQILYKDLEEKIRNFLEKKLENPNLRDKIIHEYVNFINKDIRNENEKYDVARFLKQTNERLANDAAHVLMVSIKMIADLFNNEEFYQINRDIKNKNINLDKILENIFTKIIKTYNSAILSEKIEEKSKIEDSKKYFKVFKENYIKIIEENFRSLKKFVNDYLILCLKENNFLTLNELHSLSDGVVAFLRSELLNTYTKTIYEIIKNDEQERKEVLDYVITNNQLLEKILKSKYKPLETISNEFKDHDYKSMIEKNRILPLYQLSIDFLNIVLLKKSE